MNKTILMSVQALLNCSYHLKLNMAGMLIARD